MVNCPTCNSQVRYIEKNQKYYCDNCKAWQNIPGPQAAKNYRLIGTITPALEYRVGPGNVLFGQPDRNHAEQDKGRAGNGAGQKAADR